MNKDHKKEIVRRNRLFKHATPAQKRVLVAKDVLTLISTQKLIPESGIWLGLRDPERCNRLLGTGDLRKEILVKENTCEACALGSLFVSCTLFNNNTLIEKEEQWNIPDIIEDKKRKFSNGLIGIFSRAQLRLIEIAFEGGDGGFTCFSDDIDYAAKEWRSTYPNDKDRLIAIMNNIIKNNGTFKP